MITKLFKLEDFEQYRTILSKEVLKDSIKNIDFDIPITCDFNSKNVLGFVKKLFIEDGWIKAELTINFEPSFLIKKEKEENNKFIAEDIEIREISIINY